MDCMIILKNNGKHITAICILLLLLTSLFSCSTIPAPKDDNDTLLIIPVGVINKTNEVWYGNYSLVIQRASDGAEVRKKKIPRNEGFTYVSSLPPGDYKVEQLIFFNNSKSYNQETRISITPIKFTLEAKKITVFSKKFIYSISTPMSSSRAVMKVKLIPLGVDDKREIIDSVRSEKSYSEWNNVK